MKLNKAQRQILIWLVGLLGISFLMHYFGTFMIWGLALVFAYSVIDFRFANKLQDGVEKVKEVKREGKDFLDKVDNLID